MLKDVILVAVAGTVVLQQVDPPLWSPNTLPIVAGVLLAVYVIKEIVIPLIPALNKKSNEDTTQRNTDDSSKITRIEAWVRDLWYQKQLNEKMIALLEELRDILRYIQQKQQEEDRKRGD